MLAAMQLDHDDDSGDDGDDDHDDDDDDDDMMMLMLAIDVGMHNNAHAFPPPKFSFYAPYPQQGFPSLRYSKLAKLWARLHSAPNLTSLP